MRACFDRLNSNKSTSSVKTKTEQGKRKRRPSEVNKMWLPKGIVNLIQIPHVEKLNIGSKNFKPFVKKKKNKKPMSISGSSYE